MCLAVLLLAITVPFQAETPKKKKKKKGVNATPVAAEALRNQGELPEESLLDIGIRVLHHGLPEDEDALFDLELEGVYLDVRKSEARYIPVRLMDTLQATGYWGVVRIVPAERDAMDVMMSGSIIESTGKELALRLRAVDAAGRVWLDQSYKERADAKAYRENDDAVIRQPFQGLYHQVANELLAARKALKDTEIQEIREISGLRFAANVLPSVFGDYLDKDRKGRTVLSRLPAQDDPMMRRVAVLHDRDDMFVDRLTEHFKSFYVRMDESYRHWRMFSYDEQLAKQKLKRQAKTRKALGALAIAAGAAIALEGGGEAGAAAVDAAVLGGVVLVQSGIAKAREAQFHVEALRELAASFNAEVEPLLVDVEGRTLQLTGSVEARYSEWRKLLREIFAAEIGLPPDPEH